MRSSFLPSIVAVAVAAAGGLLAWRAGGARDPRGRPPEAKAESTPTAAAPRRAGGEADEVAFRLIDELKSAHIEVPSLRAGLTALDGHWRKMQAPWTGLSGTAAKLATSYALLTSDEEKEFVVPLSNGDAWKPDARVWNMAEGSFDQRDAIFAPTPSRLRYHLAIPRRAALDFSVTTDNAPGDVTFTVEVTDAQGNRHEAWSRSLGRRDTKRWFDARVDLSAYGGQTCDVSLVTTVAPGRSEPPRTPALAMWGNPVVLSRQPTRVPYSVLWIVVDATRADAIASFHDDAEDAEKRTAKLPPLEALLPKVPGLTPELDALTKRGVRFTHAYSVAPWTRPGTVAMLGGARSTELGLDALHWVLPDSEVTRFYASDPPLLPLLLRRQGVVTRAFVNNYFMIGYASVGVDLGFEAISDYRYRTRDTAEITAHAVEWLKGHKDERFFLFCNYNSPHEPLDPPARLLAKVPAPPAGPTDPESARYMAEVAKDDEAIGVLLRALDETGLRDQTIVVMTADHGETLSSAHAGIAALDHMKVRYHHSASNYEETTHVPIVLSLPGRLPEDLVVPERVRSIDIAPTLLDLEGMDADARMSGRTLTHLIQREPDGEGRVVVSEGRGTHGYMEGDYRLLTREGKASVVIFGGKEVSMPEELFDLRTDPGERRDLTKAMPAKAAELKAKLDAALRGHSTRGATPDTAAAEAPARVSLRFAPGGAARRLTGSVTTAAGATMRVHPVGIGQDALRTSPGRAELAFTTSPASVVGVDIDVTPPDAPLQWEFFFDDRKMAPGEVFAGPFGLAAPELVSGLSTREARAAAFSPRAPFVDPRRDFGLFVSRERGAEAEEVTRGNAGAAGNEEMKRLMREWGYAHDKDTHGAPREGAKGGAE